LFIKAVLENHIVSLLIMVLTYIDYTRKYNTDRNQRSIFLQILLFAKIALILNLVCNLLNPEPVNEFAELIHVLGIFSHAFQLLSFCFIPVLVDYTIHKDPSGSRKIKAGSLFTAVVYFIFLISFRSDRQIIHIIFRYIPVVIIIAEIVFSGKSYLKRQIVLLLIFCAAISIGVLSDRFLGTIDVIWPCYSTVLLFIYLGIIRTDLKIDALTGIGNRYAFGEFIETTSKKGTKENENSVCIVMMDIDRFKKINDAFGHAEGDNALKDMAAILTRSIRHTDFVARYGGDEFVLAVYPEYDIQKVMDRILESIKIHNEKNFRPYTLEISYGYDIYSQSRYKSMDDFISHVDKLMYKQKEERRRISGGSGK